MIKHYCDRCGIEVKIDKHRVMNYVDITALMTKYNGKALESAHHCIFCESYMEEIRKFCKAKI